jgi:hypothetical protein
MDDRGDRVCHRSFRHAPSVPYGVWANHGCQGPVDLVAPVKMEGHAIILVADPREKGSDRNGPPSRCGAQPPFPPAPATR